MHNPGRPDRHSPPVHPDEAAGAGHSTASALSAGGTGTQAGGGPLAFTFGHWFTWTATGIALPALGLFLAAVSGRLAAGTYESLPVFAATHVATLGWATMTIMGAGLQMAPVLLGERVNREQTIPGLYLLFTAGVLAIISDYAGRLRWWP